MPKQSPCSVTFLVTLALLLVPTSSGKPPSFPVSVVLNKWDVVALQGVRDSKLSAPVVSRSLAVVHTCIYDAWAAYDEHAVGTQLRGALRRPLSERTLPNKERAISYAACRALSDVLPVDKDSVYTPLMRKLGYDPEDNSSDIETATGIGNVACAAVLEFRHHDKSNQLGELAQGQHSDWTAYVPANTPSAVPVRGPVANPDHWQPLIHVDQHGNLMTQLFAGPQWCFVTPFALTRGKEFRSALDPPLARYGTPEYRQQAEELIALSAGLTDRQKVSADYWADGPNSEQPPGHWMLFAQFVSARDHHTLDDDVKMFFALSNALLDAGIASWDAKRAFDSVRPVTAISVLFRGQKIQSWGGPGKGTVAMDGSQWIPYQQAMSPTPPFPEYVSGHSTYSAAAAEILRLWTERPLRLLRYPAGWRHQDRTWSSASAAAYTPVGDLQGSRGRSGHVAPLRRNPL